MRSRIRRAAATLAAAFLISCGAPGPRPPSGGALALDVLAGERGPILEWRSREIARLEVVLDGAALPLEQDPGDPMRFRFASAGLRADLALSEVERGTYRAEVACAFEGERLVERLALRVRPEIGPIDEVFAPAITPTRAHVVPAVLFRSPHATLRSGETVLSLVPDVDLLARSRPAPAPAYLALRPRVPLAEYGFTPSRPDGLGFFEHGSGARAPFPAGESRFAATLLVAASREDAANPRRRVAEFLWRRHGRPRLEAASSGTAAPPLHRFAALANSFVFHAAQGLVWHRFTRDGREMGGAAAAVPPDVRTRGERREPPPGLTIENRAGACAAANAVGLALLAEHGAGGPSEDFERPRQARLAIGLALAAPQRGGLFPAVLEMDDGGSFESGSWRAGPAARPPGHERFVHVASAATTARAFVEWVRDVSEETRTPEIDAAARKAARRAADALLSLQRADGSFPSWVHEVSLAPSPVDLAAESAAAVAFLASLARSFGAEGDLEAARRGGEFLVARVLDPSLFEDAETHFSIAPENRWKTRGVRDPESGLFATGTSAVAGVAEAFLELAAADSDRERWVEAAERALDALALAQGVWAPAEAGIPSGDAFGAFGVTNADDAPADARAGRFGLLFLEGYRATGREEYFDRGVAALRAGFATLLAPENPGALAAARERWPSLGEGDYGAAISIDGPDRTPAIRFDRDAGSSMAAFAVARARFGDVYVDVERGRAFGVDAVAVAPAASGGGFAIRDLSGTNREVRVVWSSGETSRIALSALGGDSIAIRP